MSTRERILTIRLMEKVSSNPAYAKALGVEVLEMITASDHRLDAEKKEE